MRDPTEPIRRRMLAEGLPAKHAAEAHPKWTTDDLRRDFEVIGFATPFVVVKRKSDGAKGSLEFTHWPRAYFNWQEHKS